VNPVRRLRDAARLTQSELARRAGTSQPTVAAYESGDKSPTLRTIDRLAAAAGREAVVTFVPPLTREDRRSLLLHESIARRLEQHPDEVLRRAAGNLRRMRRGRSGVALLVSEWRRILRRPIPEIVDVLLDPRPRARDLRQVTPFAGVLSAAERAAVYRAFRAQEGAER
jgi:transcriptional regulator with XRE-family HTH domain